MNVKILLKLLTDKDATNKWAFLNNHTKHHIRQYFYSNPTKLINELKFILSFHIMPVQQKSAKIYHGKMTIKKLIFYEYEEVPYLLIKAIYTNPSNFTKTRIKKTIKETCDYYYQKNFQYKIPNLPIYCRFKIQQPILIEE